MVDIPNSAEERAKDVAHHLRPANGANRTS